MIDRAETKRQVREKLRGKWGICFLACAIPSILPLVLNWSSQRFFIQIPIDESVAIATLIPSMQILVFLVNLLVLSPMVATQSGFFLNFLKNDQMPSPLSVCDCFSKEYGYYFRCMGWKLLWDSIWSVLSQALLILCTMMGSVGAGLILSLLLGLWSINRSIAYSMTPYLIMEHPQLTARKALRASITMTAGMRGQIFVLYLSFGGWLFLTLLTFGILAIYVTPYIAATVASYYEQLHDQQEWLQSAFRSEEQQP